MGNAKFSIRFKGTSNEIEIPFDKFIEIHIIEDGEIIDRQSMVGRYLAECIEGYKNAMYEDGARGKRYSDRLLKKIQDTYPTD